MTFDALKFVRRLERGGFSHEQAEAIASAVREALHDMKSADESARNTSSDMAQWFAMMIAVQTVLIVIILI